MGKRLLLLVLFLVFVPASALACSCATLGPAPCSGLSANDVVFVGTVLHIDNPAPEDGSMGGPGESHDRFRIDEKLAGTQNPEIDVYSGRGGGDCRRLRREEDFNVTWSAGDFLRRNSQQTTAFRLHLPNRPLYTTA
jgi:hypothetical protein